MRNLRTLLWMLLPTCVLVPLAQAQMAQVTALSPSLSQAVDGVTVDTSGLGVVRITHGGVSGFMFMELPQQISVVPCPSGGGSCLAPSTITVRHTIRGLRQVSIIVNGFCVGPVSGFGFVANESFTCPMPDARLDEADQIFARAQVTLQRAVGDPAPLLNLFFKWQVTRTTDCPAPDAFSRAAGETCPANKVNVVSLDPDPGLAELLQGSPQTVRARVRYTLASSSRALLSLRAYDKEQDGILLGASDFANVGRTAEAGEEYPLRLDFQIPSTLTEIYVQVVLIDEINVGNILARSIPQRFKVAPDGIRFSDLTPDPASPLDPDDDKEQSFKATVQYTLATEDEAILDVELRDHAGTIVSIEPSVVQRGSGTRPVDLSGRVGEGLSTITLRSRLTDAGRVIAEGTVVYPVRGGIIVIRQATPAAGARLLLDQSGKSPEFNLTAEFKLNQSTETANVIFVAQSGSSVLGSSPPKRVERSETSVSGTIPPFVATGAGSTFQVTAVIFNPETGNVIGRSLPLTYHVQVRPQVTIQLGIARRYSTDWLRATDPASLLLRSGFLSKGWTIPEEVSHQAALRVSWDQGSGFQAGYSIFAQIGEEGGVKLITESSAQDPTKPNELVATVDHFGYKDRGFATEIVFLGWVEAAGERIFSDPVTVTAESVSVVTSEPDSSAELQTGESPSQRFFNALQYYAPRPGLTLHRLVLVEKSDGTRERYPMDLQAVSGAGTFRDEFFFPIARDTRDILVVYSIYQGTGKIIDAEAFAPIYKRFVTRGVLSQGVTAALDFGKSSIKNAVKSGANWTGGEVVHGGVQKYLDGLSDPKKISSPDVKLPPRGASRVLSALSAQPEMIGLPLTWEYDPPIPADGSFAADLELRYSPADLPEQHGVEESGLRMISYNPETGVVEVLPTTIDTVRHTATARVNRLDAVYTLAVPGPFTRGILHSPLADAVFWDETVVLANPGAAAADTILTGYDRGGAFTQESGTANPRNVSIGVGGQFLTTFPDPEGGGFARIVTSSGVSGVSILARQGLLEAVELPRIPALVAVLPDILRSRKAKTNIHLVNPSKTQNVVRLGLWSSDGAAAGTASVTLGPNERLEQAGNALFPDMPAEFQGYITLESDSGVMATEFIHTGASAAALGAQVPNPERVASRLYGPLSSGGGLPETILNLVNPTTIEARFTLTGYLSSGARIGSPVTMTLASGRQVRQAMAGIFSLAPGAATLGSVVIDSDIRGLAGNVVMEHAAAGWSLAVPLDLEPSRSWVIPYFSGGNGFHSEIAVQNTSASAVTVQVQAILANGSTAGIASSNIPANGALRDLLEDLIPPAAGQQGYLRITADQPVIPFGLLGRGTPIQDMAAILPQATPGQGNGAAGPSISATPANLDFGTLAAGATLDRQLTVRNTGTTTLTLNAVTSSNPAFAVVGFSGPLSIPAGAQSVLTVRATGSATGQSGQLSLASNDAARPQLLLPVTVSGAGPLPGATIAGVLNAASFQDGPIAPGEIVTIFGRDFGPGAIALLQLLGNGRLASNLAGTRFLFDNDPAPIVYVVTGQAALIVPYSVAGKATTELVIEYQGRRSDPITLNVARSAPGLFSANSTGTGPGAILNQNGSVNTPQNPIERRSIAILFGTGEGLTTPVPINGSVTAGIVLPQLPVSVTIGGVSQKVLYAGAAPSLVAGVLQINIEIHPSTPSGNQPVIVTVGNARSQAGLTIAIADGGQQPAISIAPTTLDFGSVNTGQTKDLTLIVRNNGTAPLSINSITSSNPRFAAALLSPPFNVGPGSFQNAIIRFSPTVAGAQSGTLTIASNDPANPAVTVGVSGTGSGAQAPVIVLEPASLDFGAVAVGQTRDLNVAVRNSGSATLTVNSVTSSNGRFALTQPATPFNVGPGSFQNATIRFSPNAAGAQSGTVSFSGNASAALNVSGTGQGAAQAPVIVLDPAALDFGTVTSGQTKDLNVVVRNTGNATLTVSSVTSSNPRFGLVILSTPFNVGAGSFQNATIRFSPNAAGAQTGAITFNSNDPVNPARLLTVTGTGSGGGGSPGCTPAAPNLIGNGGFEEPSGIVSVRNILTGGSLPCWSVVSGDVDQVGTFWTASEGTFSLDLDGFNPGAITQTFATTPGTAYTVAFDFAGNPSGANPKRMEVSAAGQTSTRTFDSTGRSAGNMGWSRQTFTFTANATSTTLRFASLSAGGNAGPALDNVCVIAGTSACGSGGSGGGGGGGADTLITLTAAAGFPNGRVSNQLPPLAIDGSTSTFTWTTESFANANPSYLAVSLGASISVGRLRIFKDNDAGGPGLIAKNLIIEYTTSDPSTPLASRVWQTVSGLVNGFNGMELLNATAVNANGTVTADNHDSLVSGWASLSFTPVNATGIRIGFSNVTPLCCNHYRVYELQLYGPGTSGGGGVPPGQIPIAPNTTAAGTLTTSSAASTGCVACFANVYRLTVDTPQFIVIRLNSTAFDAYLQLLDLSGNILAADDDSNGGTNARISGTFQPGTYLIEVTTALQGQTGPYVLALNPN